MRLLPRRVAAKKAGVRPVEFRQLEQLVDGSCWMTAKATAPAGSALSGQECSVGLRNLRARGLVEYSQDQDHRGYWRATGAGILLVMETRP